MVQIPCQRSDGRFVEIDGISTFYIQTGEGHPVVLVHGASPGACTQINWKHNIDPLAAAGLEVYAFDQPGFGYSGHPIDHSTEYRVAHARAFIDAMGWSRFHLVGNSMGAYIAARIALEDPRVTRLVLVASGTLAPTGSDQAAAQSQRHAEELRAVMPTREHIRTLTMRTLFNPALVTEELVDERLAMSSGPRYEAQVKRHATPPPRPLGDDLRRLRVKTLILWGANDRGAAVERAVLLLQMLPEAELHIFNRCGHWVQWDQAARFNSLVGQFLA